MESRAMAVREENWRMTIHASMQSEKVKKCGARRTELLPQPYDGRNRLRQLDEKFQKELRVLLQEV